MATEKTGKVRIVVNPAKIQLAKAINTSQPFAGSSAPALLNGKIVQIISERETVRIVVESAVNIAVSLPLAAYQKRQLMVGEDVSLAIPQDAVEVL